MTACWKRNTEEQKDSAGITWKLLEDENAVKDFRRRKPLEEQTKDKTEKEEQKAQGEF